MNVLFCAFCNAEVALPAGLNDPTAKAICDQCYELGGRLPKCPGNKSYEFQVDPNGRVVGGWWPGRSKWKQSKDWKYLRKSYLSNPVSATVFTLFAVVLLFVPFASFIVWPVQSLFILLLAIMLGNFWRYVMRKGWLD